MLSDCDAVWHPAWRDKTKAFIQHLNQKCIDKNGTGFMKPTETSEMFATKFDFGQSLQYHKQKFIWLNDSSVHTSKRRYGLHEDLRHFFYGSNINFLPSSDDKQAATVSGNSKTKKRKFQKSNPDDQFSDI